MNIPGLGEVSKDPPFDWYRSEPVPVAVLNGQLCQIVVVGYDIDPHKDDFHTAIANFHTLQPAVLHEAESHVFCYFQDKSSGTVLTRASDVWRHVTFGSEPMVMRRTYGDRGVYVSLDCGCDWETEHGLQIVFKNGLRVSKIGPFDGHLTHSDALGDDSLEDVVYPPRLRGG